jgi:ATP-dependent Zn protease
LAEEVLLALLPEDPDLAGLPLEVIEGAFQEGTTVRVAKALACAANRLRMPLGATTLDDIVLNEAVANPVNQLVDDVRDWQAGRLTWRDVSSSILLYGPPGNGKTLLATALAGSMSAPLVATSYSDCQQHGHQGDMLKALSRKVEEAVRLAPSVFFLDELDGFSKRDKPGRSNDYIVGVVNGLLEHLTRLNETPGVVVLGATNYPHLIDPAVIRPGRYDVHLRMDDPDRTAILAILRHALQSETGDFQLGPIADQLLGLSAAQVTAMIREARGLARRGNEELSQSHLTTVSSRVNRQLDPAVLWRMAVHEAGHLLIAHELGLPMPVKASITMAGGAIDIPTTPLDSLESASGRLVALLGGRAAEQVVLGYAMNGSGLGATSDLALATQLAFQMHFEWGLSTQLSSTCRIQDAGNLSTRQAEIIEAELQSKQSTAVEIIEAQKGSVMKIATALMTERELNSMQLWKLLRSLGSPVAGLPVATEDASR